MKLIFSPKIKKTDNFKISVYFLLAHQLSGCGGGTGSSSSSERKTLTGSLQNDLLISSSEYSRIEGLAGDDKIYGADSAEKIFPGMGADEIYASAGKDEITIISFGDLIDGGDGDDTLYVNFSNSRLPIYASFEDGIIYNTRVPGLDRSSFSNIENIEILSDNDSEIIGSNEKNVISTAGGADKIYSGSGDNIITSGGGNDTVLLGSGVNSVNLGSGNDSITLASFQSTIDGGSGRDQIAIDTSSFSSSIQANLGTQIYVIDGSSFNPNIVNFEIFEFTGMNNLSLEGSANNETIISSSGSDIINGKGGGDIIYGGSGSDKFIFDNLSGIPDVIMDFSSGLTGDVMSFSKTPFNLSGTSVQEITTTSGGKKVVPDNVGAIIVKDQSGFSSENALKTALSGVNGITTNGENLEGLLCLWWKSSEQAAVVSLILDETPQNMTFDEITQLVTLQELNSIEYADISTANIEII